MKPENKSRFTISLPDIDYRTHSLLSFPELSNTIQHYPMPEKFVRWGSQSAQDFLPMHGFTDDWRIESIWRDKYKGLSKVLHCGGVAVAPDYTVDHSDPFPYVFYQVWRSRVIARYWQESGVFAIPVLQWTHNDAINRVLFSGLKYCDVIAVRSPSKGTLDTWLKYAKKFLAVNGHPCLVLHCISAQRLALMFGRMLLI